MTAKRLVALVAAALLVVGAFVVRRNVIEDDDGPVSTDDAAVTEPARENATEVVCITELRDVCTELQQQHPDLVATIEDAGTTLDRLAELDDPANAPVWLTIDPFPAMVDELRQNDPLGFESDAVGASQLAVAFPSDGRAEVITSFCESESQRLWQCIGANAGTDWSDLGGGSIPGALSPSLGEVPEAALALVSFGHSVASYFGETNPSATRFGETSFITWLRNLSGASEGRTQQNSTPLATMAVRPALDTAATATFEVAAIDDAGDEFDVNYSEPQMWIQAVIATPAGVATPDDLAADVTRLLAEHDWNPPTAAEAPPPSASTLLALRALWDEIT